MNTMPVFEAATDEKRAAAAAGVRDKVCGELKSWFDQNIEKIRKWVDDEGLKGALKQIWSVVKTLTKAAVAGLVSVVGSALLAYLLIGVAVAAVGAAIYFLVKEGLPNFCAA